MTISDDARVPLVIVIELWKHMSSVLCGEHVHVISFLSQAHQTQTGLHTVAHKSVIYTLRDVYYISYT